MTLEYNVGPVETGPRHELRVTVIDARGHAGADDFRRIRIQDLPHNFAFPTAREPRSAGQVATPQAALYGATIRVSGRRSHVAQDGLLD